MQSYNKSYVYEENMIVFIHVFTNLSEKICLNGFARSTVMIFDFVLCYSVSSPHLYQGRWTKIADMMIIKSFKQHSAL